MTVTRRVNAQSACKATFGYSCGEKQGYQLFAVYVPENLLWSPEGLVYLFNASRGSYLPHPSEYPDDPKAEEAWESFHIVSVEQCGDSFVIDGIETPYYEKGLE